MIEILLKNKEIIKVNSPSEILYQNLDFHVMQSIDYTDDNKPYVAGL